MCRSMAHNYHRYGAQFVPMHMGVLTRLIDIHYSAYSFFVALGLDIEQQDN